MVFAAAAPTMALVTYFGLSQVIIEIYLLILYKSSWLTLNYTQLLAIPESLRGVLGNKWTWSYISGSKGYCTGLRGNKG